MITYDLAKKLKEAGFPFKETKILEDNISGKYRIEYFTFEGFDSWYFWTTLSELIESCGGNSFTLYREVYGDNESDDMEWKAECRNKNGIGISPEEAVANLWLELNKKN